MYKVTKGLSIELYDDLIVSIRRANEIKASIYDCKEVLIYDASKGNQEINIKGLTFNVNPITNRYTLIPIKTYTSSSEPSNLEFHTGAYNYLVSKEGYQQIKSVFSLRDAVYRLSNDGSIWNGYVLFNHQTVDQIDVGVSIFFLNGKVVVRPFYFYMGGKYPRQFYLGEKDLSVFTRIDENAFKGNDEFEVIFNMTTDGWYFKIVNLTTSDFYEKQITLENIHDGKKTDRFIVGASLVPVKETLWNPNSNSCLTGVLFKYALLNNKYNLYPSSQFMKEGYAQGFPLSTYKKEGNAFSFSTNYQIK